MSDKAHSVAQRLLNFSKARNEEYTFVLARYGVERLLYRLSLSPRGRRFVLKGASLFLVWFGHSFRTTRDVDLLGEGASDLESMAEFFRELCRSDTASVDGLVFQENSVQVQRIKPDQDFEGVRVRLRALLGRSRVDIQVDIGFGDAVTPPPELITFPALLDAPAPMLLAYTPYSAVAEKFHAMVSHDFANTRMKDFYDLCILFRSFPLDKTLLAEAVKRTFEQRGTALPVKIPVALTAEFTGDALKLTQWKAFVQKNRLTMPMGDLAAVMAELQDRFSPVFKVLGIPME